MCKSQFEDRNQEILERKLSKKLGISFLELAETEYDIDFETSEEGEVYNLIIKFKESSSKKVLKKIKLLDHNNHVYLLPFSLD